MKTPQGQKNVAGRSAKASLSKSPTKAGSPKSLFASGPYKGKSPKKQKDNRNVAICEGFQNGVVLIHFKRANADEAAFLLHDFKFFKRNEDSALELGINKVLVRKGVDGRTEMKQSTFSDFKWEQLMCIVGEPNNTATGRKDLVTNVIRFLNESPNYQTYQYLRRTRRGEDLTCNPMRTLDTALLDTDVCAVIKTAFPDVSLLEASMNNALMETFWIDVNHGAEVMETNAALFEEIGEEEEDD